jgi:hypothetical protein
MYLLNGSNIGQTTLIKNFHHSMSNIDMKCNLNSFPKFSMEIRKM